VYKNKNIQKNIQKLVRLALFNELMTVLI